MLTQFCVPARCVCTQCADKLRVRPEPSTLSACPKFPKDMKAKAKSKIHAIKDSHKGETCVLIANGPSLNKIRWDWQDNFNVVMGMNKIFLGLERYNISKMTHCERRRCFHAAILLAWHTCRLLSTFGTNAVLA